MDQEVQALKEALLNATQTGIPTAIQQALSLEDTRHLLWQSIAALKAEPTLLELTVADAECEVVVVGDTHGQYHDVCHMLDKFGYPGEKKLYVFNGDFVDRGSFGVELMILLLTLKIKNPNRCYLIRGNHESTTCTTCYGFKNELQAKWGKEAKGLYVLFKKLFAVLPLAAVINSTTLVLHGGLFRKLKPAGKGHKRRKKNTGLPAEAELEVGDLDTLRKAGKGGLDPDGLGGSVIAADVLWSDPVGAPVTGLKENDQRGIGLVFGADVTQAFLEANGLKLILRSHEGPDSRCARTDLPDVQQGWALDHDTPAGRLMTVFSAPDYPQFMPEGEDRYENKAAVAVLTAPSWNDPKMISFDAVQPRPQAIAYYDFIGRADTDLECSDAETGSAMSTDGGTEDGDSDHEVDTANNTAKQPLNLISQPNGSAPQSSSQLQPASGENGVKGNLAQQQLMGQHDNALPRKPVILIDNSQPLTNLFGSAQQRLLAAEQSLPDLAVEAPNSQPAAQAQPATVSTDQCMPGSAEGDTEASAADMTQTQTQPQSNATTSLLPMISVPPPEPHNQHTDCNNVQQPVTLGKLLETPGWNGDAFMRNAPTAAMQLDDSETIHTDVATVPRVIAGGAVPATVS